jgi:hypothetical protein
VLQISPIRTKPSLPNRFSWRHRLRLSLLLPILPLTDAAVTTAVVETATRTPLRSERKLNLTPTQNDVANITATLLIPILILHPPSLITPGSNSISTYIHDFIQLQIQDLIQFSIHDSNLFSFVFRLRLRNLNCGIV